MKTGTRLSAHVSGIAAQKPEGVPEEKWLPINRKDEDLSIRLRIYVPDPEKMETWHAPKAERVKQAGSGGVSMGTLRADITRTSRMLLATVCLAGVAGCAGFPEKSRPAAVPEIAPGVLAGYLKKESYPDSLKLLSPPPAKGSAALAVDEEISRKALALRDTPRWRMATADAELRFPQAAGAFVCALGAPVTEKDTPHLYVLLRRAAADAGLSTYAAKDHYRRTRPFLVNKQPTCTPAEEKHAAKDFSYPSGHSALGWAWALVLAEIAPERGDAILARGRAFGESRIVCNVHWESDVVAGRFMGTATVARLHADPGFRKDIEAAKAEYAAVRAGGLEIGRDCKAEAEALSIGW